MKVKKSLPDIDAILDSLDFSGTDDVVEALAITPRLFMNAADYRIACLRNRNQAEMNADLIEAQRGVDLRKEAAEAGEKLTEKSLEQTLTLDPDVVKGIQAKFAAVEEDEYSKLVVEAFRMRRDCLESIGRIAGTEMSYQKALESNQQKLAATREKLKQKYPGKRL
jgi:ABC-type Fe3+-hydroxamate transport system substrate-binding protein